MSKIRPTPETAEVTAIRKQYDAEAYELRLEISDLRDQLAHRSSGHLLVTIGVWIFGVASGVALAYLVIR